MLLIANGFQRFWGLTSGFAGVFWRCFAGFNFQGWICWGFWGAGAGERVPWGVWFEWVGAVWAGGERWGPSTASSAKGALDFAQDDGIWGEREERRFPSGMTTKKQEARARAKGNRNRNRNGNRRSLRDDKPRGRQQHCHRGGGCGGRLAGGYQFGDAALFARGLRGGLRRRRVSACV